MDGYPWNTRQHPDHVAAICETESLTYAELDDRASRLAGVLVAAGVAGADLTGVILPNSIELIECLVATAKLGIDAVPLEWQGPFRPERIRALESGIDAFVVHVDRLAPDQYGAPSATAGQAPVVWIGDDYEDVLRSAAIDRSPWRRHAPWPPPGRDGRWGEPDTPEDLFDAVCTRWGFDSREVHLVAGPLHEPGPHVHCFAALHRGGTVVVMESWDPFECLRLIDTHRVTSTCLDTDQLTELLGLDRRVRSRMDTSSLRRVIHSPRPDELAAEDHIDLTDVFLAARAAPALDLPGISGADPLH